jgi:hypothetical protein
MQSHPQHRAMTEANAPISMSEASIAMGFSKIPADACAGGTSLGEAPSFVAELAYSPGTGLDHTRPKHGPARSLRIDQKRRDLDETDLVVICPPLAIRLSFTGRRTHLDSHDHKGIWRPSNRVEPPAMAGPASQHPEYAMGD